MNTQRKILFGVRSILSIITWLLILAFVALIRQMTSGHAGDMSMLICGCMIVGGNIIEGFVGMSRSR